MQYWICLDFYNHTLEKFSLTIWKQTVMFLMFYSLTSFKHLHVIMYLAQVRNACLHSLGSSYLPSMPSRHWSPHFQSSLPDGQWRHTVCKTTNGVYLRYSLPFVCHCVTAYDTFCRTICARVMSLALCRHNKLDRRICCNVA